MSKEDTKVAVKAGNKEVSRVKYEYMVDMNSSPSRMNELGAQGWEAWSMIGRVVYYKRELI